jgi:hypothetical protein
MEQLKTIKDSLIGVIQGQMGHLEQVDAKELGEVIDMVKDIEEAIYYCTITKAMEEKEKSGGERVHHHYYNRDMDKEEGRMYYDNNMGGFSGNTSSNSGSRHYTELEYPMMRDSREGRSPMSRRTYMESKEMHQPKTTQMKELEKYLQELSSDIVEMIQDASPEEKSFMEKKISALAAKINPPQ